MTTLFAKELSELKGLYFKLGPIVESFFIIYKVLYDQEESTVSSQKLKKQTRSNVQISSMVLMQEEQLALDKSYDDYRAGSQDIKSLFNLICLDNKELINFLVQKNKTILNDSLSMVVQKMPAILEFDSKR